MSVKPQLPVLLFEPLLRPHFAQHVLWACTRCTRGVQAANCEARQASSLHPASGGLYSPLYLSDAAPSVFLRQLKNQTL